MKVKTSTLFWSLLVGLLPFLAFGAAGAGDDEDDEDDDAPDQNTLVQSLVARFGDAKAAVAQLASENRKLRQQRRELRGQLPPEGAVILQGDEAAAWDRYQQLGKADELASVIEERDRLKAETAQQARRERVQQAAALAGYKPTVLAELLRDADIVVEGEGDTRRALVVHGEQRTPLTEHATKAWGDFLPALRVEEKPAGTGFPPQDRGGDGSGSLIDQVLAANKARAAAPNPLRK